MSIANPLGSGILGGGGSPVSLPTDDPTALLEGVAPDAFFTTNGAGNGSISTAAQAQALMFPSTAVSLASATGWTARGGAGSGTASVNTGSQRIDLSCLSGSGEAFASIGHAPWSTEPMVDYRARLSLFTATADTAHYALAAVVDALAQTIYLGVQIFGDNTVGAIATGAGSGATYSVASITGGQGWVRLVVRGNLATCYAGVGSAGAQPASWTPLGVVTTPGPVAPWAYVLFQAGRGVGGDITAQWESIAYTVTP